MVTGRSRIPSIDDGEPRNGAPGSSPPAMLGRGLGSRVRQVQGSEPAGEMAHTRSDAADDAR